MEFAASSRALKPPATIDFFLIILTVVLISFSMIMVYSTTGVISDGRLGDSLFYVKRQAAAIIAGMMLMIVCSQLSIQFLRRISPYLVIVCLVLLLLPLLPGVGQASGGARRWINLGYRFQPTEFVKVMFVIFMAGYFSRHEKHLKLFTHGMIKPFMYVAVMAGLLLLQPDFGSSAILALVVLGMGAAVGVRLKHIVLSLLVCMVAMGGLIATSPYRMRRVLAFLSPMDDVSGQGYQLIQSLIAVGSGKFAGAGLGASQQKLFFLPAAHTDFIFAVVGEELGFVGCVCVILAFLLFLWRGFVLASKFSGDVFPFALAVGLTLLIVMPAFLNMGVVVGLLPTKGLVLPLIAYGGSSMVASLAAVGILLSLARTYRKELR